MNQSSRVGLVVGVPTRGAISIDWMAQMMEMLSYMPNGLKWHFYYVKGKPVEEARTDIVEHAKSVNARHLLFIDDDTFAPANAVLRLWNARKPIITGVVYSKSEISMPMVFEHDGEGPWVDLAGKPKGLYRIESAGLAMSLINMDIFKKLEPPYFQWLSNHEEKDHTTVRMGEDTFFYKRIKDVGIEAWVDSEVLCLHGDTKITEDAKVSLQFYPTEKQAAEYMALFKK